MKPRTQRFIAEESGTISMVMALALVVLLGLAALGIDYGYMSGVQSELKKAAEAGALAGARALVPYIGTPPHPNWSQGQAVATSTVQLNRADGQYLTDCTVNCGYWSLTAKTLPLQSSTITPTSSDIAAIQVVVAKSSGQNGGPISLSFASIFGINTKDLSGSAVAILSFSKGMPVGSVFPLVAAKSIVDQYWNTNPPVSFRIGSGYSNGQWTSFKVNDSSAGTLANLISGKNSTALSLNDNIWLQPGAKASVYGTASSYIGLTVIIPLVNPSDLNTTSQTPILGFVAFKIEATDQGGKYIQGHFDKSFNITNATTIGPPTPGTLSSSNPPYLVN